MTTWSCEKQKFTVSSLHDIMLGSLLTEGQGTKPNVGKKKNEENVKKLRKKQETDIQDQ